MSGFIRKNIRRGLLLFLLTLFFLPVRAYSAPLLLADAPNYSLAGHLETLADPGSSLTLADILTAANLARFRPIPGYLNTGYTNDTVWVSFTLLRKASFSSEVYLHFWPPYLDNADVYFQVGENGADAASYTLTRLGDHVPVADRPIIHPEFIAPFNLPLDSPRRVFVKLRTSSSLSFFAEIHSNSGMINHGNLDIVLHSGYLAIALIVSAINLIFFFRLRDYLYLYFSLYVFALFINNVALTGILSLIWPSMAHILSDYFVSVGVGLLLIFFALFGMQLFNTRESPWVHRFFQVTILIGSTTFISVPFGWYNKSAPVLIIWSILIVFFLTWLSSRRAFFGGVGGKLYLAAFGASNIGYLVQFFRVLGLLPLQWWNIYAMQIGSTLNMVLMTLALTERLHSAEQKALQLAREAEHSAVKLAEEMTIDLRNKQQELEENLERKASFLDMVSHEYRTPLAIIRANLDILDLRHTDCEPAISGNIAKMRRAVARLVEVVESSLLRSRMKTGELKQNLEYVDVAAFLEEVCAEARGFWPGSNVLFDSRNMSMAALLADKILLKTALLNVIDNAVKYSPPDEPITISFTGNNTEVAISIADIGVGIPENELIAVREKFVRGEKNIDTIGKGLGLFLVIKILEEHGGRLELAQNLPNGTIATIVLPRVV